MIVAKDPPTHLVVLNYSGDTHEAIARRIAGLPETYFAQYYSITAVEDQLKSFDLVTSLSVVTNERYDVIEQSGMRSVGLGLGHGFSEADVVTALAGLKPTHVIFRAVMRKAISWAVREGKQIVCVFAESLTRTGLKLGLTPERS